MQQRTTRGLGICLVGLIGALAGGACSDSGTRDQTHESDTRATGGVGIGLTLPDGSQVTSVTYTITHNGGEVRSGTMPVGPDGRASVTITGLDAGNGYKVVLRAERPTGAACQGEATFAIMAQQTTTVDIVLSCDDLSSDTLVTINGQFNICPRLSSSTVSPTSVDVGSSTMLNVSALDRDGDALVYAWSAASGTFSPANAANTTYTCSAAGSQNLTLTITDARGCAKSATLIVNCVASAELDGGVDGGAGSGDAGVAHVQLLGFNDFHGNIEPPSGSSGTVFTARPDGGVTPSATAGGAAFFAQHVAALRAQNPNTLVVSAGDLIGASPLVSALFHDEPTIEAMNLIGLDINGVGNHEFDEGRDEILRMQRGGCHPVDGCQDGTPFAGASFQFLAANVVTDPATGATLFDRYTIRDLDGARIAFIGMTLEATPTIVTPSGVAGLMFRDEAETVNAIVPELLAQGVRAIVVVIHEGGFQTGLYGECLGISGEIVDIVNRLHAEVDLVISGHTHAAYNCLINGKRVTSALSFGRLITQVQMSIDRATQNVVALDAVNRIVTRDVTPVPVVSDLVTQYVGLVAPLRDRVIGEASAALTRATTPSASNMSNGESTLGNVIADAQLAATRDPARAEPQIAFMNPGGVRADIDAGPITYGEVFTAQPFGNSLVALSLTGAQIDVLLEQQFQATTTRVLHPSANVSYVFDFSAALGNRVSDIRIDGVPIDATRSYRVTVNSFLATGGDGFAILIEGSDRVGGDVDIDALEECLTAHTPISPPAVGRIMRVN